MIVRLNYDVKLQSIHSGYDGITCWVHARAGAIPGAGENGKPAVVLTMQKLLLSGSDVYYGVSDMRTDDLGATWSIPIKHSTLGRRREPNGIEVIGCDYTPKWHRATGRMLITGHTARYKDDRSPASGLASETAYSIYDAKNRTWTPWTTMKMPDDDKFFASGAGCTQRVDLPDGTILLPMYYLDRMKENRPLEGSTVVHCSFDGSTLRYLDHGDMLTLDIPRGFSEPSLTYYKGRYFLTLRNDEAGYVTSGPDGLHFDKPQKWCFDDGNDLGNYNTQQHWVTHSDGLFLVYTRRGANNDHVFRHRAPLFMAQVDSDRLCVIRETERILVPERGARLGNFGAAEIDENQTWVTVTEWMQGPEHPKLLCSRYGSDNSVFVAKIIWEKPNHTALKY